MSKMSQLHAELTEQASELGFKSIEEAEANGYHIDYTSKGWKLKLDMAKAYEGAHKAWLEEKRKILNELNSILNAINGQAYNNFSDYELLTFIKNNKQIIAKTIEFIEKGEM